MTPEKILEELYDFYRAAREDGAWPTALRALELIGKHLGMWTAPSSQILDLSQLVMDDPLKVPNETDNP